MPEEVVRNTSFSGGIARGVYSPLSGGSQPLPPMVHVGDHGMIHALYGYYTYREYIGVSEQEEMIKAQIIFEGAKN